jgi:radical SAM protein (TIGR04043 family)/putative N-acetyltransferase (TIGR04045 family)
MLISATSRLITNLQSLGIRVPDGISGRKGGAGPAEGRAFILNDIPVNIPISANFVSDSPYLLKKVGGKYILLEDDKEISEIGVVPEPQFYRLQTQDGISYQKIALFHGNNCLATTVLQECIFWRSGRSCAFCGTELSLKSGRTTAKKTPPQLAQVAMAAKDLDGVSHVVLTSGTGDPPSSEISYLADCAQAIKQASDLPIHAQFIPPEDLAMLETLKSAGIDTVGIHIESFDEDVLASVAPAKAAMGFKAYEGAWQEAVRIFGSNQVSSFLIAGLGESPQSIVWGSEVLADLGVYPYIVPLRAIPGSKMAACAPPAPETMTRIYTAVASILKRKGLSSHAAKAGCVRCGACSALHTYEKQPAQMTYHSARNEQEIAEAFAIRHAVFVKEQGLFETSDVDQHDAASIHLVAKIGNETIGTVRVFQPEGNANGHWIGGRLAVLKRFRKGRAGAQLVKEAMKRVKKKGATCFTAHIQEKNVPFFKRLGWRPIASMQNFMNRPHQKMQADLNQVPDEY